MADNVTTQSSTLATVPASTKISTDEDATNGHVQRVKLAYSEDGSSTHITADANGLRVQGTVTATGTSLVHVNNSGTVVLSEPISVDDNGSSLTVDGTVSVSGTSLVHVNNNGTVSITGTPTVQATNLDIRDLTSASDSVSAFVSNNGTVSLSGTSLVHVNNSGTVTQGTSPWITHQSNSGTVSVSSISAGDNNIGNVDVASLPSQARRVTVTPTISTSPAYTTGDALGGLMTFSNAHGTSGGSLMIDTVTILDLAKQSAAVDLVLFDQTFTASTDNAVFDPSDADAANIAGVISLASGHYADFNDWSVATKANVGLHVKLSGSTSLFGQLVVRAGPTYVGTTDIKVVLTLREV